MVLNQIAWAFKDKHYSDLKEFNEAVEQYQVDILGDDDVWNGKEVVAECPAIEIRYMAWIKSPRELNENETLTVPADEIFNDDVDEDEYQQVEIAARFEAQNGKSFAADEFLMKAHNAMVNKKLGDELFLEGVEQDEENTELPIYYVICGS